MTGMNTNELVDYIQRNGAKWIAIDGRCGSGKTTLAACLREALGAQVIHMDDFYLRLEQRTKERYREPGGNVDRERFLSEVLEPLRKGSDVSWHPFSHLTMSLSNEVKMAFAGVLTVVEGSYSLHPDLRWAYDLKIFSDISPEEQRKRILTRNGANAPMFFERWIPLEELYFEKMGIRDHADIIVRND